MGSLSFTSKVVFSFGAKIFSHGNTSIQLGALLFSFYSPLSQVKYEFDLGAVVVVDGECLDLDDAHDSPDESEFLGRYRDHFGRATLIFILPILNPSWAPSFLGL